MFASRTARPAPAPRARPPRPETRVRPARDTHEGAAERAASRETGTVPPAAAPARPAAPLPATPNHLRAALGSSGRPLPSDTRTYFEARLGHDLDSVRVH